MAWPGRILALPAHLTRGIREFLWDWPAWAARNAGHARVILPLCWLTSPYTHRIHTVVPLQTLQRYYGVYTVCIRRDYGGALVPGSRHRRRGIPAELVVGGRDTPDGRSTEPWWDQPGGEDGNVTAMNKVSVAGENGEVPTVSVLYWDRNAPLRYRRGKPSASLRIVISKTSSTPFLLMLSDSGIAAHAPFLFEGITIASLRTR